MLLFKAVLELGSEDNQGDEFDVDEVDSRRTEEDSDVPHGTITTTNSLSVRDSLQFRESSRIRRSVEVNDSLSQFQRWIREASRA